MEGNYTVGGFQTEEKGAIVVTTEEKEAMVVVVQRFHGG